MSEGPSLGRAPHLQAPALWRTRLWRIGVAILASAEAGLLGLLAVLLSIIGMVAGLEGLRLDWARDWGSESMSWAALLLVPFAWSFSELGRCLMWSRWREGVPMWRLRWFGLVPVWLMDPADVARLRQRSWRISVHLWGLMFACLLVCVAWLLSRTLDDPEWQWVARAWLYASVATLVCFQLNPFWHGAAQQLLQEWWHVPELDRVSRQWWLRRGLALAAWLAGVREPQRARAGAARLPARVVWYAPLGCLVHALGAIWLVQQLSLRHPTLALVLLASATWALLVRPAMQGFVAAWRRPPMQGARWRFVLASAALLGAGLGFLIGVPWPQALVAQAVVCLPDELVLRAPMDGRIAAETAADGQSVYDGQALWTLQPLHLSTVDRDADAMVEAPGDWGQLVVRSPAAGLLVWALPGEPLGRVVRQGQVLARVVPQLPPQLRWGVPARHAQALQALTGLEVRTVDDPERVLTVPLSSLTQQPMTELPARALSTRLGGAVPVLDNDPRGVLPAEPLIAMQASLSETLPRVGGRAWVRMALPPEPIAWQLWAWLRSMWQVSRAG